MSLKQSIDKNLEQYAFDVAAKFIDRFDEESQANVIKLLYRLNSPTSSGDQIDPSIEQTSNHFITNAMAGHPTAFIRHEVERQRTGDVVKPIEPAEIFTAERQARLQRALAIDQENIDSTTRCIARMDLLIRLAQQNTIKSSFTDPILRHYRAVRAEFITRLTNIQVLHQQAQWKLDALKNHD